MKTQLFFDLTATIPHPSVYFRESDEVEGSLEELRKHDVAVLEINGAALSSDEDLFRAFAIALRKPKGWYGDEDYATNQDAFLEYLDDVAEWIPAKRPVYYYVQPAPYLCPAPVMLAPAKTSGAYAQPQAAPPSPTKKEPPLEKKRPGRPTVSESQGLSQDNAKVVPVAVDGNGKEMCRVGFWNVSGRDVKLNVDGKAFVVLKDRSLTVNVNRAFTWQINGKDSQAERVPDDASSQEIVIR